MWVVMCAIHLISLDWSTILTRISSPLGTATSAVNKVSQSLQKAIYLLTGPSKNPNRPNSKAAGYIPPQSSTHFPGTLLRNKHIGTSLTRASSHPCTPTSGWALDPERSKRQQLREVFVETEHESRFVCSHFYVVAQAITRTARVTFHD
jgi:hypothetical protein